MSNNIIVAINCLKAHAEDIEEKIDAIEQTGMDGCPNCGMLTQEDVDKDQEMRILIQEIQEISQALEYLESLLN